MDVRQAEVRSVAGAPGRVLWQRCLLALNLSILVFSVYVVWTKIVSADERSDESRALPLSVPTGAGVTPTVSRSDPPVAHVSTAAGAPRGADERGGEPRVADTSPGDAPGDVPRVAVEPEPPADIATVAPSSARPPASLGPRDPAETDAPAVEPERDPEPLPPVGPPDAEALRRVRETRRRVGEIGVQLELVHNKDGGYPTSAREFGAHRGVEALLVTLLTHDRGAGLDVGDADSDGRLELLDAWGRPFVYFSADDYASRQEWASAGRRGISISPARSRRRGVPQATGRYQLWSVGQNGRDEGGLGDDIPSWVLRD